jgi:diguanylate cyclase (GGDEF)-like protein/PAS domain S-box-containing protein
MKTAEFYRAGKMVKENKSRTYGSAELAKALMRCAGTGIYIVQDGRFIYVNPLFQELTGYTEQELLGVYALDLVHPDDKEVVHKKAVESLKAGRSFPYEYRFIKKDGGIIWVLERLSSTTYKGKRSAVGSFMDITERKHYEEALVKSEEKYRTILEEIEEGYYETDLAGNYTFFNDVICKKLGYSRKELTGMNFQVHTDPEDVKKISEAYYEIYRTGKPLKWFPPPQIRKDGARIFAEDSVSLLKNERGEVIGFRGVSRDLTERVRMEEALRRSEERYRTIMDETHDDYYEVDLAGNYTFVNDAWCRSVGYTSEELIGINYKVTNASEDIERTYKAFNQVYLTGQPIKAFTTKFVRKDGSYGLGELSAFPMRNEQGEIIGFRGVSHDVTERVRMEEALRQSEERYRTILAEIEEGYYEVDLAGNIRFVNKAACRQFGYSEKELIGSNYRAYVPKEDIKGVYKAWNKVYRTGEPLQSYPFATVRKDGTQIFVENSVSPLRDKSGSIIGFRAVSRDVTQRKQFEQKLADMATHDPLTGLPNRSLLNDRLTMGLALSRRNGNRLAILMLDLDRFKVVNDTMGHAIGDQLLKAVAGRLEGITRKSDTIARMGGDEFVLVLPQISSPNDSGKLAQRILDVFEGPFVLDGHQLKVTTSIGIAIYPDDGKEIEILLKNADNAMYQAKEEGRDMYRFYGSYEPSISSKA